VDSFTLQPRDKGCINEIREHGKEFRKESREIGTKGKTKR
jgi:hypothetical protein